MIKPKFMTVILLTVLLFSLSIGVVTAKKREKPPKPTSPALTAHFRYIINGAQFDLLNDESQIISNEARTRFYEETIEEISGIILDWMSGFIGVHEFTFPDEMDASWIPEGAIDFSAVYHHRHYDEINNEFTLQNDYWGIYTYWGVTEKDYRCTYTLQAETDHNVDAEAEYADGMWTSLDDELWTIIVRRSEYIKVKGRWNGGMLEQIIDNVALTLIVDMEPFE